MMLSGSLCQERYKHKTLDELFVLLKETKGREVNCCLRSCKRGSMCQKAQLKDVKKVAFLCQLVGGEWSEILRRDTLEYLFVQCPM